MKKILSLILSCALITCLFAGCGNKGTNAPAADEANGEKVVKIGVYEPQSGDNGAGGKQELLGMQYANTVCPTVTIGGEEYKVQLEIVDNQSSNDKGPSAAADLVNRGVSIVLGSYGSGVSIAAADTFKKANVPAVGVTCTNPAVTEGNSHYFRICFVDPFQGTVLANYAQKEHQAKKAYVLTKLGDDYSGGLGYYFTDAFKALGGEVVEATFQEGNADFNSYITSAVAEGCDVFFAPTSTEAAALIIEQMAAKGANIPLMAGDTWDSNVITNAAKGKNVKIYVTTFYQEGGDPVFDAGVKEWINSDATAKTNNGGNDLVAAVTAMGYDAYFTALEALKLAGSTDPAAVMEALPKVSYTGISGLIEFNEIGDAKRDLAYVKSANTETGLWDLVTVQGVK